MNKEIPVEEYYKREAKKLTDLLFNKGFLDKDLSRQSINWLEDFLGYIMQTQVESAVKANEFLRKIAKSDAKDY